MQQALQAFTVEEPLQYVEELHDIEWKEPCDACAMDSRSAMTRSLRIVDDIRPADAMVIGVRDMN